MLARYEPDTYSGRPWADLFEPDPDARTDEVVAAVRRELAGHLVSCRELFADSLIAAGGRPERRSRLYTRDLDDDLPGIPRTRYVLRPAADYEPSELVDAAMAAYPSEHVDFLPGEDDPAIVERRLVELIEEAAIGTPLPCSRVATDANGRVLGAALVVLMDRSPPFGGPWLAELFRRPESKGAGMALLAETLRAARDDGHESFGLVVTEGNPAAAIYERAGCRYVGTFVNVVV